MTTPSTKHQPLAGKKGALTDSATTNPDLLASSRSVLQPARPGAGQRGLQQYFTPEIVSTFASRILRLESNLTLDPTAGNGSLLSAVPRDFRFGIEIDSDFVADARYTAVRGDIQRVFPLLRAADIQFPRIVANPPFGLDWSDPFLSQNKQINSTLLTWRYCLSLLEADGAGLFIAGRDRFQKLIAHGDPLDANSVVLTIDMDHLFPDVALPITIAFFVHPTNRTVDEPPRFTATIDDLSDDSFVREIRTAFRSCVKYVSDGYAPSTTHAVDPLKETWATIQDTHDERLADDNLTQTWDVMIKNGKLSVKLSPFAQLALARHSYHTLKQVQLLHGQNPAYFAINQREWNQLRTLAEAEKLTIEPDTRATIEEYLAKNMMHMRPMYPLPPQMRLGFLADTDQIRCTKDDPDRGFRAGSFYPINVGSKIAQESEQRPHEQKDGTVSLRKFTKERKILRISIDRETFTETKEDIEYLLEHFDIPEVGDLAANHPEEVASAERVLHEIADENNFEWADFQAADLARIVVKERALLTWAQGGGKTAGILGAAEALIRTGRAKNQVLIVAPQDLHDQWSRELQKFLGVSGHTLTSIETPAEAERVRRHLKSGGEGWYITSYEALSIKGTSKTELAPVQLLKSGPQASPTSDSAEEPETRLALTSAETCPSCRTTDSRHWSGTFCTNCSYSHYRVRVKSVASRLSTAFKHGVIAVDELSQIRGDESRRSLAIRGLRARCRIGATGTPISNYVNDAFWGISWVIGWGTPRFPYDYDSGKAKFEKDFCVLEYRYGDKDKGEDHRKQQKKVLPEVTNLSMLWKLLSLNMVRRRQTDMGDMVTRTYYPIEVPQGISQSRMNKMWIDGFVSWFSAQNPNHPLVEHDVVDRFQATLGLLWKMEYSATMPEADPHLDWIQTQLTNQDAKDPEHDPFKATNFTPKFVRMLELIEQQVEKGEKVLVGSALVDLGPLVCEILTQRGIKADHIADVASTGKARTKSPKKRAAAVTKFIQGDTDVLCVGVNAMKLGHNLDVASSVFICGLPWSHEAMDQFLARVWRRTSTKPVSVYCMLAKDTIDERKYQLLSDKAAASDVALDGRLIEEPEKPADWNKYIQQLQKQGIRASGSEIPEDELAAAWKNRPRIKRTGRYTRLKTLKAGEGNAGLTGTPNPVYKLSTKTGGQHAFFD